MLDKNMTALTIALGTKNPNKVKEISAIVPHINFILADDALDVEETGATFEENALLKAKHYSLSLNLPALADDSGLEINALNGHPGIYSARFAQECGGFANAFKELQKMLSGANDCSAQFVCALALYFPSGASKIFKGECKGVITFDYMSENGFGYDPIFIPQGYSQTFAQLDKAVKNSISHRALALQKLSQWSFNAADINEVGFNE